MHNKAEWEALVSKGAGLPLVTTKPQTSLFNVHKDQSGTYRWLAQFSNNVRDNDDPPEILAAEAHRRFVYLLDKGFVPMPQLWVWHEKDWTVGEANWVALDEQDDLTFILASGIFYPHASEFAKALSLEKDVALSHGMYPHLMERAGDDPSVITGYVSREITVLPRYAAANRLTAYTMQQHSTEKNSMAVKDAKRRSLAEVWPGISQDLLKRLEDFNGAVKEAAQELDLDTKDTGANEVPGTAADAAAAGDAAADADSADADSAGDDQPEAQDTPEKDATTPEGADEPQFVTYDDVKELLEAIGDEIRSIKETQVEAKKETTHILNALGEQITALESKEKARDEATRSQSLAELFTQKSAIGKDEARLDGRTSLAKDGPEENSDKGGSGLFFEAFLN